MTTTGRLQLTMQFDDDGTANLIAIASANGLAGRGSAWFDISEVFRFAHNIARYAINNEVVISGGYYSKTAPRVLSETHLSIRVYPIDGHDQLGVRVLMREPEVYRLNSNSDSTVELEIRTTYNRIEHFSRNLLALVDREVGEAVLEEELT